MNLFIKIFKKKSPVLQALEKSEKRLKRMVRYHGEELQEYEIQLRITRRAINHLKENE